MPQSPIQVSINVIGYVARNTWLHSLKVIVEIIQRYDSSKQNAVSDLQFYHYWVPFKVA